MKVKYLLISFLLLCAVSCKAQQSQPIIKIAVQKNGIVKYNLSSSEAVYYYVGLEKLLDKRWQEIVVDISSKSPDRGAIVNNLSPGKTITGVFSSKEIPDIYKKPGSYRFKLNYGLSVTMAEKNVFSAEFQLK